MRRSTYVGSASVAAAVLTACLSGGTPSSDAGPPSGLLVNASVPQACQSCLTTASADDCATQANTCSGDSSCETIDVCVNKCGTVDAACIQSCESAAPTTSSAAWSSWFGCACTDCTAQCSQCAASSSGGGSDAGTDSASEGGPGLCVVDDTGQYFTCPPDQDGFYCTGSVTPEATGFMGQCSAPTADPSGNGLDYCCD